LPRRTTPVIIGIGLVANKTDRIIEPIALIETAARAAFDDTGTGLLERVDGVFLSPPTVFGAVRHAEVLAGRLGLGPGVRQLGTFSGAAPLKLLGDACDRVASGQLSVALVAGGIADASIKRAIARGEEPPAPPAAPWSQGSGAPPRHDLPARRIHHDGPIAESAAGVAHPGTIFALIESVMAAKAGRSVAEQRRWLGTLMAPFTEVAARRPDLAWFPTIRSGPEISEVRPDNRLVAEPYTKLMNSFPTVDQAAAIVVTTLEMADAAGVPDEQRVYPWSVAACTEESPPSERIDIDRSRALEAAVQHAFSAVAVTTDDIGFFDLYSCFPAAVELGAGALGLDLADPRGLTVTGGLPYFGGPGASYVTHAIACMVDQCRQRPGQIGALVGVGGVANSFAAGVCSSMPPSQPWRYDRCEDVEDKLRSPEIPVDLGAEGTATVVAMTVVHERDAGPQSAPIIAEFADGRRTGAAAADPAMAAELSGSSLVGHEVKITVVEGRPTYTTG
jgi:acetyl-CoA C-acetyltransferase